MDPVSLFLIVVATIFLLGVIGELAFQRTGVPDVIWLIVAGLVLGPMTGLVERAQLEQVAPYFGALTLVIVLFDGGTGLRLAELRTTAGWGALLAVVSFVASVAMVTGLSVAGVRAGLLPPDWTVLHGVIVGTILGGSSSVVLMPALRNAGLAPRISNILNLESAITDVLCVVATTACIRIAVSGTTTAEAVAATLGRAFGVGLIIGTIGGTALVLVLRHLRRSSHAYPIILGSLLLLYVVVDWMEGSAALSILTVAVIAGNARSISDVIGLRKGASLGRSLEGVHDQITFIIKSFFFVLIGAMLAPPWPLIGVGVVLGIALLAARLPAVWIGLMGSDTSTGVRALMTVTLPRGMAAGVLAMLPHQAGVPHTAALPVVVFAAVVTTIVIFSVGFPLLRERALAAAPEMPAATTTTASVHQTNPAA